MSRRNNTLTTQEIFELGLLVRDEQAVFTDWESSEKHFSKLMGRKITKANIIRASQCCKRDYTTIVKIDLGHNPFAMALQEVRRLREYVSELEQRIVAVENQLKF